MAPSKMRTRGKSSTKTAVEAVVATASTAPKFHLEPESSNPPKVFILPDDASPEARIFNLANPKTASDTRYLCCPEKGFYEFTRIAEPRTTPRSWLLVPSKGETTDGRREDGRALAQKDAGEYVPSEGYVTKSAEMFIATPIDPLFLVLPTLAPTATAQESEPTKRLFLASDDYLDDMVAKSPHFGSILRMGSTQKRIEARMAAVCDTVEAGEDTMYRLNETKLLEELLLKAQRVAEQGLPPSMEERFVTKALEAPMLSLKREEQRSTGLVDGVEDGNGAGIPATDSVDPPISTSSTDTAASAASLASTATTCVPGTGEADTTTPSEGIPRLLRLRTALNFIVAAYLPPRLQRTIQSLHLLLQQQQQQQQQHHQTPSPSPSTIDFTPLDLHLSHLADLRQQALASRSMGDYSRKRTLDDDDEDEGATTRADRKRRKDDEEKKRKAGESRGVRELKKVNVKGMKKMSDFFGKKS